MTRTQVLQELRRMRVAEAYGGWQERRLSQEEAETRLDVKVPARECISVPGRLGKFSSVPMGDELEDASTRLGERRGSSERSEPVGVRPGSDVEEFGHDADRVVDPGGVDVEVGDHAIRIPDPDEHPVSLAVRGEGFEPVRSQLREDHVGLNGIVIDVDATDRALDSPLFRDDAMSLLNRVKLRNRVLRKVSRMMSMSRPTMGRRGRRGRRGRISYPWTVFPVERPDAQRVAAPAPSSQLAVLAAPTVVAGVRRIVPVALALTLDAQAHAAQRLAATLGDLGAAVLALEQTLAARQPAARALYGVFDARVDLILDGPVTGPAAGHVSPPYRVVRPAPERVVNHAVITPALLPQARPRSSADGVLSARGAAAEPDRSSAGVEHG